MPPGNTAKNRSLEFEEELLIVDLYQKGVTRPEICRQLQRTGRTISRILAIHEVAPRARGMRRGQLRLCCDCGAECYTLSRCERCDRIRFSGTQRRYYWKHREILLAKNRARARQRRNSPPERWRRPD